MNMPEIVATMSENLSQCAAETSEHADQESDFSLSNLYGVLHTEQQASPFSAALWRKVWQLLELFYITTNAINKINN